MKRYLQDIIKDMKLLLSGRLQEESIYYGFSELFLIWVSKALTTGIISRDYSERKACTLMPALAI